MIRRQFNGVSDSNGPNKVTAEGLNWYNKDLSVRANKCESWAINKDATEWTIKLRKGLKWSDGQPFTSENFKWWYDNQLMNKQLTATPGADWGTGAPRQVMTMAVPDQYTVVCKFAHPKPLWFMTITRSWCYSPSHYLKQFHQDFVTDKAAYEKAWKDLKFNDWQAYFGNRNTAHLNLDRPGLGPWIYKSLLSEEMFIMERNPYFWQVDSAGNQLPYWDKIQHRMTAAADVRAMWVVNGEIDFQARNLSFSDYTIYKQNESKGKYKVFLGVGAGHDGGQLNLATKNLPLREFFSHKECRIAMSIAINRAELNDLLYDGMAVERQYSPLKASPQYYEKTTKANTQFDAKKANEMLDAAGYSKKDAEGIRLYRDGSGPISFIMEGTDQPNTPGEDAIQMVCKYWKNIGIKATYKYFERSLYTQHYSANDCEAAWWGGDRTVLPLAPGAPIFLGTMIDRPWAGGYGIWKNDPTNPNAIEPPKDHFLWKLWDIWDNKVSVEPDVAKQNEYFRQILDIWAEECPMQTVLGEVPIVIIVKDGVKGYLAGSPIDDTTEDEHLYNTQTYYWDDPKAHGG
jgi:peptide/nickel transport system substrate-binding protein